MAVKRYDGSAWQVVAGKGDQGTSSSISTWVKTASGGETSLSGNDDNSQSLSYTVGQELVFINGTLLKRGSDYTATNGTSITGLTALAANDVATVWTVNAFSVTGAIANTIVDAKGDLLVGTGADTPGRLAVGTNGQVLTAASTTGTGLTWTTPAAGALTFITSATPSGAASQSFNNCFSATYQNYLIVLTANSSADDVQLYFRMRASGTDATGSDYSYQEIVSRTSTIVSGYGADAQTFARIGNIDSTTGQSLFIINIGRPFDAAYTSLRAVGTVFNDGSGNVRTSDMSAVHLLSTSYDGITLYPSSGNFTGTIRIYGYANS